MNKERVILILILVLAAALRFYDLTYQSLWGDEAFSIYDAKCVDMSFMISSLVDVTHRNFFTPDRSLGNLIAACLRNEGTPPAYFIALAAWLKAFGSGDFAVRSLSAVLGVLSVAAFYLLGRRLFRSSATALVGALFIAVSPLNIYFSQEARAYILANLIAILCCWLFLRAAAQGSRTSTWIAYGFSAIALLYSFYFAGLIILAQFLYLLIHKRPVLRPWFITMVGVGILYAPWCIVGLKSQMIVSSSYIPAGSASTRELLLGNLHLLRYILDSLALGPMYSRALIGSAARLGVEIFLCALLIVGAARLWLGGEKKVVTFSLLIIFAPLFVILAFGFCNGTFWYMKPRYHMWEASGIFLLAAASIMTFRRVSTRALLASAFCLFSLAAAPYHIYPGALCSSHAKPDFRSAGRIITGGRERGDIIIVNTSGHMIPLNIYYTGGLRQVGMAETGRYDLTEKLGQYTRKRRRVWFLLGKETVGHGDEIITAFLDEQFPLKETHDLRGLRLTLYRRDGPGKGRE